MPRWKGCSAVEAVTTEGAPAVVADSSGIVQAAGGAEPLVVIDRLSKHYAPLREPWRIERILAKLGGIELNGPDPFDEEEDEFEDEELDEPVERPAEGVRALDEISLSAYAGTCVAVVGPAKAGKSILLKVIAGVVPPTSGRVVVRGTVAPALEALLGVMPRDMPLEKALPVLAAMVHLPRRDVRRRMPEIFDFLGFPDLRCAFAGATTGKRRHQILLSMMLSLNADVVLVDCELSGVAWKAKCLDRLDELKRAGAVVIVTSRDVESVAGIADRVVYLKRGVMVGEEAPAPRVVVDAHRRESSP